jgi:hypothetical protein
LTILQLPILYSGAITEDISFIRIFYYSPSGQTREETYVKGTDSLTKVMRDLGMPNDRHSVTFNSTLLVGADTYNKSLNTLNIVEGSELKFSMSFFFFEGLAFF